MSGEEGGGDAIHRIEEVVWQEEKRKVAGNPQESCEGGRGNETKRKRRGDYYCGMPTTAFP